MPIYEYSCRKCNQHIEVMQKVSDKPLARHAGCGGKLEKEWSRTGFQFKGTGWYVTDYAGRKPDAASDSKETKGEGASDAASPKADTSADAPAAPAEKKAKATKPAKSKSAPAGD